MVALLALITTLIWGLLFPISKTLLANLTPYLVLTIRLSIVSIIGFFFFPKPPIPIHKIFKISIIFSIFHLGSIYWSLYLGLDASLASVLEQIGIPILLIVNYFYFKEPIKTKTWIGITLAITGTFILMNTPNSIQNPLAFCLILSSGLHWALYSISLKKIPKTHPIALMVWISIVSLPMATTLTLLFESPQIETLLALSWTHWLGLTYLGLAVSVVAHGLWYYLVQRHPMESVAPYALLVPMFGVMSSILFLNETLTLKAIFGTLIILIGLGIILFRRPESIKTDITS